MNIRKSGLIFWSNLSLALFACLFFSGCATTGRQKLHPIGRVGRIGIMPSIVNNRILITGVEPGFAAEKAGLQPNDFLVGYNGRKLENLEDRQALWREVRAFPGKTINLSVERRGQQIPIEITIGERDIYAEQQVLNKLGEALLTHKKVALAVIVTQINYVGFRGNEIEEEKSKVAAKTILESSAEKDLLNSLGWHENFVMVDRSKLEEIFKELHFQGTGAVSPEFVKNVGRMAGASHIAFIDFTWDVYNGNEIINMRLIDVESGTVLAVDTEVNAQERRN